MKIFHKIFVFLWLVLCLLPILWFVYLKFFYKDPGAANWDFIVLFGSSVSYLSWKISLVLCLVSVGLYFKNRSFKVRAFYLLATFMSGGLFLFLWVGGTIHNMKMAPQREMMRLRREYSSKTYDFKRLATFVNICTREYILQNPNSVSYPIEGSEQVKIKGLDEYIYDRIRKYRETGNEKLVLPEI